MASDAAFEHGVERGGVEQGVADGGVENVEGRSEAADVAFEPWDWAALHACGHGGPVARLVLAWVRRWAPSRDVA